MHGQRASRERQARAERVADGFVVPWKPGNAGGGKGPWFEAKCPKWKKAWRLAMSLTPPATVGKLQKALGDKAKASPSYRFYALYDKLYRRDILEYAYRRCKANAGCAGVD